MSPVGSLDMKKLLQIFLLPLFLCLTAQPALSSLAFEELLGRNAKLIQKSSSKTVDSVLDQILEFGGQTAAEFMQNWKDKTLYYVKSDGRFVIVEPAGKDDAGKKIVNVIDAVSKEPLGLMPEKRVKQIKPNSGVRAKIAGALAPVQLASDNIEVRREGLAALSRDIQPSHLLPLQQALAVEPDASLKRRLEKTYKFAVIAYSKDEAEIVTAIHSLKGDLSLEARAALNPLLASKVDVDDQLPAEMNIARLIIPDRSIKRSDGSFGKPVMMPGSQPELTLATAYQMLVNKGYAPEAISADKRNERLVGFAEQGYIGELALSSLNTEQARNQAYDRLVSTKGVPPRIDEANMQRAVSAHVFYAVYDHPSAQVTNAARQVLSSINSQVTVFKLLDLALDGLSLASIYFLAAIGLAITFGVMRVINMAHGEFIMMGAYTGYMIQLIVPSYTVSIFLAIPAAFCVTFMAGVLMERLVIRHLYKRPLETLLATFGISIALQQIAKNIFGTQARPLTSPSWLDGAFVVNDVLAISNIRIAIFCLGLLFLGLMLYVMTRTRFGLETRAVTQNPAMAASMGINPDRINMLTFGFGSGIAGIAGVAIGLFSKVTSELGSDYIVQSFMTVVVGGVGNIWGTLAGAALIGSLQKAIEWFNPSNTLAAQTYMIIFIILFIQFRPRGIIALKGRAAED